MKYIILVLSIMVFIPSSYGSEQSDLQMSDWSKSALEYHGFTNVTDMQVSMPENPAMWLRDHLGDHTSYATVTIREIHFNADFDKLKMHWNCIVTYSQTRYGVQISDCTSKFVDNLFFQYER